MPPTPRLAVVAAIAVITFAAPALSGQAPPPAYSVGGTFDPARGLVIFGGFRTGGYSGDTWEFADGHWTRSTTPGPSGRNGPAMAYDSTRHQIVLFGGDTRASGPLGDTWLREGTAWRQVDGEGPPARSVFAMTWDARRERVVLFGGSGATGLLGDTWEWDGSRWARRAVDGPPARTLHALAYDPIRGRVVLYGGRPSLEPDARAFDDTWEWDGTRWQQINVAGPGGRDHHAMHWDPVRRKILLVGGMGPDGEHGRETWSYDGRRWERLTVEAPRRRFPVLTLDPHTGSLLLFGGFDDQPSNDLFRLDTAGWTRITPP
jgi:hypothetical protein